MQPEVVQDVMTHGTTLDKWAISKLPVSEDSGTVHESSDVAAAEEIQTQAPEGSVFPSWEQAVCREKSRCTKKQKPGETEDFLVLAHFPVLGFSPQRYPDTVSHLAVLLTMTHFYVSQLNPVTAANKV